MLTFFSYSTATTDFIGQINTTVTFAPDETVQIVNVTVVNDDTLESTEMFTAMLTATPGSMVMIGAADTATATITDDDSKPQCHQVWCDLLVTSFCLVSNCSEINAANAYPDLLNTHACMSLALRTSLAFLVLHGLTTEWGESG